MTCGSFFSGILGFFSLLASITLIAAVAYPDWRISQEVTYHYMDGKVPKAMKVGGTKYGLYVVKYAGTSSRSWTNLRSNVCEESKSVSSVTTWKSTCGMTCRKYFNTKCESYSAIEMWGIFTISTISVSCLISLTGVFWLYWQGPYNIVVSCCWVIPGLLSMGITLLWIYMSKEGFDPLTELSQFPYPELTVGCLLALIGSSVLTVSGGLAAAMRMISQLPIWQRNPTPMIENPYYPMPPGMQLPYSDPQQNQAGGPFSQQYMPNGFASGAPRAPLPFMLPIQPNNPLNPNIPGARFPMQRAPCRPFMFRVQPPSMIQYRTSRPFFASQQALGGPPFPKYRSR